MDHTQDNDGRQTALDTPDGNRHRLYEQDEIDDDSFDYAGYQVVRGEYFAHLHEPSITFSDYRVSVNKACLNRDPTVDYVQILVNPNERKLAVRFAKESERASFLWRSNSAKGRNPKQVRCPIFFAMLAELMDWHPNFKYKLLGKFIRSGDDHLIVFDLTEPEVYQRRLRDPQTGEVIKPGSRIPSFPKGWEHQFGVPLEETKKSLQINIFHGYAVYGIAEERKPKNQADCPQPSS